MASDPAGHPHDAQNRAASGMTARQLAHTMTGIMTCHGDMVSLVHGRAGSGHSGPNGVTARAQLETRRPGDLTFASWNRHCAVPNSPPRRQLDSPTGLTCR